jgi:hypothetical protein
MSSGLVPIAPAVYIIDKLHAKIRIASE